MTFGSGFAVAAMWGVVGAAMFVETISGLGVSIAFAFAIVGTAMVAAVDHKNAKFGR